MKKKKYLVKYLLWLVIISSLTVFAITSYRQVKRLQASKRLESLGKIESQVIDIEDIEIDRPVKTDEKLYSNRPNPQKKWLDINSDYQGWLDVGDTRIDYPVVRANDNNYYLDRDFFKEKSEAGSIFMDYRNIGNFKDRHTAIYGHYQNNGEMFADLHKYKEEDFAIKNKLISFEGLYERKEFEIFSVYVDSADDYELRFNLQDNLDYENYLIKLKELSMHSLDFEADNKKLLLTLATCSYEIGNGRLIVHAIEK